VIVVLKKQGIIVGYQKGLQVIFDSVNHLKNQIQELKEHMMDA